ncbi:serine/threonine-protein kinase [Mycobacterium colombiense]|uniref:serine/threonine-protein kinase n=1 Tax=Mycobacterium colombiense TaxID=339268 RepID=UPI00097CED28|nr:serine/threonine-protein kinase [Mycobacterium colombiense]MCK8645605.1 serine/threonine protein kinase [Mycobacterium colombiense]
MAEVGTELRLDQQSWTVTALLARGGFGIVYIVENEQGNEAVAKLVPKAPGAERELLIGAATQAAGYRNVLPILDSGEHEDYWVLVMPRAEKSLDQYLRGKLPLSLDETVAILRDVAEALADIDGNIVHRDLKPPNILWFNNAWHIADFGIARYAEATTAPDTNKFALTPHYAAPEQWLMERATSAADVYAFGVMAYQMISGELPFTGPSQEDLREQHLNCAPPSLTAGTMRLRDLIEECLMKAPGARPTPAAIATRLERISQEPISKGLRELAEFNEAEVQRRKEVSRQALIQEEDTKDRQRLHESAVALMESIGNRMVETIQDHAPTAKITFNAADGGWIFVATLGVAELGLERPRLSKATWTSPFTVISEALVAVKPFRHKRKNNYAGRSHSIWFCDAKVKDRFAWFELAFMSDSEKYQPTQVPFAEGADEAGAFEGRIAKKLAWPVEELERSDLDDFLDRWLGWFAAAAMGELDFPPILPEREPTDTYRHR